MELVGDGKAKHTEVRQFYDVIQRSKDMPLYWPSGFCTGRATKSKPVSSIWWMETETQAPRADLQLGVKPACAD